MKNYVDIARRIQMVNNYTFKKKDDYSEEAVVHPFNDISGIHQNNLSDININRDFNLVDDMIPLNNRNNLSEIIPSSVMTNNHYYEKSKISQEEISNFNRLTVPKIRNRSNTMKESYLPKKEKKNFPNKDVTKDQQSVYYSGRKSEFNNRNLDKFITSNFVEGNNRLLQPGDRNDMNYRFNSYSGGGNDLNLNRDRSKVNRSNNNVDTNGNINYNSYTVPILSDYSPNPLDRTRNSEQSTGWSNYNNLTASPRFMPTISHNPYIMNQIATNNIHMNNSNNNINVGIIGKKNIDVSNNQIIAKKNSKNFDYNRPPPVKKGIFSLGKSGTPLIKNNENQTTTGIDLSSFLNFNSNGYNMPSNSNNISRISNFTNFNNLNVISRQLNSLQNNNDLITRDASQSMLDNSHLSLVEKYQIKKDQSVLNLNKSENMLDETDKISVKSMKSTGSMNFNKYKIGLNAYSTSKLNTLNDNTRVSDLSTLIKYENSSHNANYGKILIAGDNHEQIKKFEPTDQTQFWKENFQIPLDEKDMRLETEGNINISTTREVPQINLVVSEFKNRPIHERESRRMQIELLKLNLKDVEKTPDISKILKELKLNPIILDRPTVKEPEINSNNSNTFNFASIKRISLKDDPRLQSILNRDKGITSINNNNSGNNKYINNDVQNLSTNILHFNNNHPNVPNSDSASSYVINTIKSTAHLNYSLDEDSNDKINMLCFLATPRLLYVNITNENKILKVPFIFQLSPTNSCHKYGLEHYIFQWCDVHSLSPVNIFINNI